MRFILFIMDVLIIVLVVGGLYVAYKQGKEDVKDNPRKEVK